MFHGLDKDSGDSIRQLFCCVTLWYFFTVCYWKWPIEIVDLPMRVIFWIWASCDQQWFSSQENVGERSFDASGLDQQYFFGCMMGIQPLTIFLLFCFPTEHGDDVDIWWYMLIMIWCFWWWWYDGDDDVDEGQWFLQSTSSSTMVDCDINDVRTPGSVRRSQATAGIYFTDWMVKHGETKQFEWISWWFVSMQLMVRNASTQLID